MTIYHIIIIICFVIMMLENVYQNYYFTLKSTFDNISFTEALVMIIIILLIGVTCAAMGTPAIVY